MPKNPSIYLSSVLLEKNRWRSREPSFKVSDWSRRIADAGFDGIELWENHLLLADSAERDAVLAGPSPVAILNTYCGFDDAGAAARAASAGLARFLDVPGVKFNFGNEAAQIPAYLDNLLAWRDQLPAGCRLLCECHPGTVLEAADKAVAILAPVRGEVEIIVHAMGGGSDASVQSWLDAFGPAVTHIHVAGSGIPGERYSALNELPHAPRRIEMLKGKGFSGTWSVEFCKGVAAPPEDMAELLAAATRDLDYLRKEIACCP